MYRFCKRLSRFCGWCCIFFLVIFGLGFAVIRGDGALAVVLILMQPILYSFTFWWFFGFLAWLSRPEPPSPEDELDVLRFRQK